jgi:hypothetical protein
VEPRSVLTISSNDVTCYYALPGKKLSGHVSKGLAFCCELGAMNQDKIPISVTALRAEDYSSDGKNIIISMKVKYTNTERMYSIPVECFYDLITDLRRLNATTGTTSIDTSIQPAVGPNSAEKIEG